MFFGQHTCCMSGQDGATPAFSPNVRLAVTMPQIFANGSILVRISCVDFLSLPTESSVTSKLQN
jgi:hypothetical protein